MNAQFADIPAVLRATPTLKEELDAAFDAVLRAGQHARDAKDGFLHAQAHAHELRDRMISANQTFERENAKLQKLVAEFRGVSA